MPEISQALYDQMMARQKKTDERKVKSTAKRKAMADLKKKYKSEYEALVKKHGG